MDKGKELAKADRKAKGAALAWGDLEGIPERHMAEAETLRAEIVAKPNRAKFSLETTEEGRALRAGNGAEGSDVLNSIRLHKAAGTCSGDFAEDLMVKVSNIIELTGDDKLDAMRLNAALALVGSIEPENELEATLAVQIVQANALSDRFIQRALKAQYLDQAKAFAELGLKAQRATALHAETLAKLRRNGEQVVKHVHVNEGGQAVIAGTVNHGGGGGGGGK